LKVWVWLELFGCFVLFFSEVIEEGVVFRSFLLVKQDILGQWHSLPTPGWS
jgi:hypothetical protein